MAAKKIAQYIKARRTELKKTQQKLSDDSGLPLNTIQKYESGRGPNYLHTETGRMLVNGLELTEGSDEYEEFWRIIREDAQTRSRIVSPRGWFLERMKESWINGVYETHLHGIDFITLQVELASHAVARSASGQSDLPLAADSDTMPRDVLDCFDGLDSAMLILGEAGAGKTMQMLELARKLIIRARGKDEAPVPAIVPLASWAVQRLPLGEWLEHELVARYYVPVQLARQWIDDRMILPMLDGLDDMRSEYRVACVEAINAYRAATWSPMVVCCRTTIYEALPIKLDLCGAIVLRPLSDQQIDAVLQKSGQRLQAVRDILAQGEAEKPGVMPTATRMFRDLASVPLMLSILVQAYKDLPSAYVPLYGSVDAQRRNLLDAYLRKMLENQPAERTTQMSTILSWLAQHLERSNQTQFYLDDLQPSTLPMHAAWHVYWLLDRLGSAVVVGLVLSLGFVAIVATYGLVFSMGEAYWRGLFNDWLFIFFIGALLGGMVGSHFQRGPLDMGCAWWSFGDRVISWISGGVILGIAGGIVQASLVVGLVWGIIGTGAGALMQIPSLGLRWVVLVEERKWSRERILSLLIPNVSAGVVMGALVGLLIGEIGGLLGRLLPPLVGSIVAGMLIAVLVSITFGVTSREEDKLVPNQGIHRSARNASRAALEGAIVGAVAGLLIAVGPVTWLMCALIFAIMGALAFGGTTVMSHSALRLTLWQTTNLPLRTVHFLDSIVELGLLQRVGGAYQFRHTLLRDHCAQQPGGVRGGQATTIPRPSHLTRKHRWDWREFAGAALILVVIWLWTLVVPQTDNTQPLKNPDYTVSTHDESYDGRLRTDLHVTAGDTVTITTSGKLDIGPFNRGVSSSGIERDLLELPLGNQFKHEIAFPTGALLCRVEDEQNWRLCDRVTFEAMTSGPLEFLVNDWDVDKHSGGFSINVRVEGSHSSSDATR